MISVRSEVQVFPGPPRFALGYAWRSHARRSEVCPAKPEGRRRADLTVSRKGAIAQLGERVLCKHEVVGSIPSGSTTLRLRLCVAQPGMAIEVCRVEARKSEDGLTIGIKTSSAKTSLRTLRPFGRACGISDIVKRRSIRVWDLRSNSLIPITISGTFRRSFIAR